MAKVLYDLSATGVDIGAPRFQTVLGYDFNDGGDPVDVPEGRALTKFRDWQTSHPELGFSVIDEPGASAGLRAVHRGRGSYAVVDGSTVLDQVPAMTKEDADAFNAMSDEDKAAFVAKPADPITT